jgi:hypothetical protein
MEYLNKTETIKIEQIMITLGEILDESETASQEVKDFIAPFKERLATNILFIDMISRLDKDI